MPEAFAHEYDIKAHFKVSAKESNEVATILDYAKHALATTINAHFLENACV